MTRGEAFIAELEEWLGTPFDEHQAVKGRGCDCKGAIIGPAHEIGFPEAKTIYAENRQYSLRRKGGIPGRFLREAMAAMFDPVPDDEIEPGDVLLCLLGGQPSHLAVYAGNDQAIHTKPGKVLKRTAMSVLLFYFPLDSVWRWRDLPCQ